MNQLLSYINQSFSNNKDYRIWNIGLTISILLGFLIRINGLGNAPLGIDEYYFVKSAGNIIKYGLPKFDLGGYYPRGIIIQYIMAFVSLFSGAKAEISYRLVLIIFNLLAIPAIYKLGEKSANRTVGYVAAILFCFSLWEIEFSRYIRMYPVFQTIFVWYFLILYIVIIEKKEKYLPLMFLLSFLSIFVYEGCIFLLALNFLPFLFRPQLLKKSNIIPSVMLLVFAYLFLTTDWRRFGVSGYLPPDITLPPGNHRKFIFPTLLVQTLYLNIIWLFLYGIPIGFTVFFAYKLYKYQSLSYTTKIALFILAALSLVNLYGFLIVLLIIFLLIDWISSQDFTRKFLKLFALILLVNFAFWTLYVFFTDVLLHIRIEKLDLLRWSMVAENTASSSIKKFIFLFFDYPHFYSAVIRPWLLAIPIFTFFSIVVIGINIILFLFKEREKKSEDRKKEMFLPAISLLIIIALSSLNLPDSATRFAFFLFPLLLIMIIASMRRIALGNFNNKKRSMIYFFVLILSFVLVAEDFDLHHLWNIGTKEINLRIGFDKNKGYHYRWRNDAQSPAEIVNQHASEKDIIITTIAEVEYYLKKLDYIYFNYAGTKFPIASVQGGKKEIWSNANLIYRQEDLFNLIENSNSIVWVIIYSKKGRVEREIANRYKDYFYYRSYDGRIDVYRIIPRTPE